MRKRRLKVSGRRAVYHCMTRIVNNERLIEGFAREVLRKQLWQVADFSGVEVLTYCILSTHFHVLLGVPDRERVEVSDAELMRRYRVLYPKPTKYQQAEAKVMEMQLAKGGEEREAIRWQLLGRMHDVSEYMKSLKQRFSIWYNRNHGRVGTLWSERFKSTLVEGSEAAMRIVAAYIDLNPVRAKLVEDPKEYRWSGYGEAMGGAVRARGGICVALRRPEERQMRWSAAAREYRKLLYCKGATAAPGKGPGSAMIGEEQWRAVMEKGGKLPVAAALRCRVRYFTDGAVLGSREYVNSVYTEFREQIGGKRRMGPRPMKGSDWERLGGTNGVAGPAQRGLRGGKHGRYCRIFRGEKGSASSRSDCKIGIEGQGIPRERRGFSFFVTTGRMKMEPPRQFHNRYGDISGRLTRFEASSGAQVL